MLAAAGGGSALAADQAPVGGDIGDVLSQALSDSQDQLPAGLENTIGDNGVDLTQIFPPEVSEPQPEGGAQPSPAASDPAPASPKPAAPSPKAKSPTRKTADVRSVGSRTRSDKRTTTRSRPLRAAPAQPAALSPSVAHRAASKSGPSRPAPTARTASRSIVHRVINRIPTEYRVALIALGSLTALFALISLRERRRSRRVERQAMVDGLTALPNRQAFERRLAREWRRAERYERDVGVLMLDLDDFKQINDGHGHAAGDKVLSEAAMLISGRIRSADLAARWGGDEFVVLCPETNTAGLKVLARSLEDRLKHASIPASAGFAQREPDDLGPADLLARADASMYRRKQRERGRPERRSVPLDPRNSLASLSD